MKKEERRRGGLEGVEMGERKQLVRSSSAVFAENAGSWWPRNILSSFQRPSIAAITAVGEEESHSLSASTHNTAVNYHNDRDNKQRKKPKNTELNSQLVNILPSSRKKKELQTCIRRRPLSCLFIVYFIYAPVSAERLHFLPFNMLLNYRIRSKQKDKLYVWACEGLMSSHSCIGILNTGFVYSAASHFTLT